MRADTNRFYGRLALGMAALLLLWALGIGLRSGPGDHAPAGEIPPRLAAESAAEAGGRVEKGCEIIQTMGFSRCGHSVSRRVEAPAGVVGADFAGACAYYDAWRIQSFASDRIVMDREIDLFCPMHHVLAVNEAGEIVLIHNVYGDGMAVEKTFAALIGDFADADRDRLLPGLGFDTAEEAESWLAAH